MFLIESGFGWLTCGMTCILCLIQSHCLLQRSRAHVDFGSIETCGIFQRFQATFIRHLSVAVNQWTPCIVNSVETVVPWVSEELRPAKPFYLRLIEANPDLVSKFEPDRTLAANHGSCSKRSPRISSRIFIKFRNFQKAWRTGYRSVDLLDPANDLGDNQYIASDAAKSNSSSRLHIIRVEIDHSAFREVSNSDLFSPFLSRPDLWKDLFQRFSTFVRRRYLPRPSSSRIFS